MQAYSDNQADVNGNGFHLLFYISYLVIKRAGDGGGGGAFLYSLRPPPLRSYAQPPSLLSLVPTFTSSLTHPPLLILPVPTRIGSM